MNKDNRKKLVEEYKNREILGGICGIRNTANQKILIESTTDLAANKNRFDFFHKTNAMTNNKLKRDWEQYGKEAFQFEVLEELKKDPLQSQSNFLKDLELLKELWIEKFQKDQLY